MLGIFDDVAKWSATYDVRWMSIVCKCVGVRDSRDECEREGGERARGLVSLKCNFCEPYKFAFDDKSESPQNGQRINIIDTQRIVVVVVV